MEAAATRFTTFVSTCKRPRTPIKANKKNAKTDLNYAGVPMRIWSAAAVGWETLGSAESLIRQAQLS